MPDLIINIINNLMLIVFYDILTLNDDDIHSQLVIFNLYMNNFHYIVMIIIIIIKVCLIKTTRKKKLICKLFNKLYGLALLVSNILFVSIVCRSTSSWQHAYPAIKSVSILC